MRVCAEKGPPFFPPTHAKELKHSHLRDKSQFVMKEWEGKCRRWFSQNYKICSAIKKARERFFLNCHRMKKESVRRASLRSGVGNLFGPRAVSNFF